MDDTDRLISDFIEGAKDLPDWYGVEEINIFSRNGYGDTLVILAAIQGRVDIVELLLDKGVDINAKGEHGYTAPHEAIGQKHYYLALYLIKRGASLYMKSDFGFTPLDRIGMEID